MKAMFLPPMLVLAAALTTTVAQARSIQFNSACGTVEVDRIMCVTTPCPYGNFKLKTNSGYRLGLLPVSDEVEALLIEASQYEGKRFCVQGTAKNRSQINVYNVEPEAKGDH